MQIIENKINNITKTKNIIYLKPNIFRIWKYKIKLPLNFHLNKYL